MNILKKIMSAVIALFLVVTIIPQNLYSVHAEINNTIETFEELEEKINENLDIYNGKYRYSEENIQNIRNYVNSFNIQRYNTEYGLNYTKEELYNEIMQSINNTELVHTDSIAYGSCQVYSLSDDNMMVMSHPYSACNYRGYSETWNTEIMWVNYNESRTLNYQLNNVGAAATAAAGIAAAFGAVGMWITVSSSVTAAYSIWLANEINYRNTGCGVRIKMNKFLPLATVEDQRTLITPGHF